MRAEQTGMMVARGIGLALVTLGVCSGIGAFQFLEPVTSSGWTSYSPLSGNSSTTVNSISISSGALLSLWLPGVAQLVLGSMLILFSKPVGRWLAHGVRDENQDG